MLGLVYVGFVAALILLVKSVVLVFVIAGELLWAQFWYSDRIALSAMCARLVTAEQEPYLHGVVDRLCASADMANPPGSRSPTSICPTRSPRAAVPNARCCT